MFEPFTIAEIKEFIERQQDRIGSIKMHYDETSCMGIDQIIPDMTPEGAIAVDTSGKQIFIFLIGTDFQSPCDSRT